MSNIFTKPKNSKYINDQNKVLSDTSKKDTGYVNSFHDKEIESIKDDNNVFTKSKEALYMNSYIGGSTNSAIVTITKDKIIYVDVDKEYNHKDSYLEGNVFYC